MSNGSAEVQREMPRYQSHKVVHALRIKEIHHHPQPANSVGGTGATIVPADEGYGPFDVDADFVQKHDPRPSGYFVVYADGYKSFSPSEAFETGYRRIEPKAKGEFHDDRTAIQIHHNFRYHTPRESQPEIYTEIREKAKELAELINDRVPVSREKSLAITHLEETVMWTNAGIARNT